MVMNMNHLHIFVKVGEKLNITEAAKELFISQPAVSKAIKKPGKLAAAQIADQG